MNTEITQDIITNSEVQEVTVIEKKPEKRTQKVEKKSQQEQLSCLQVEPELFDQMKTAAGVTISDLNAKGYKVLLFFTSHVGCMNCKGTMYDIYMLQAEFLKMNCIPVIVHEESYETYYKFLNSSPQTKLFSDILHMERSAFGKRFKLKDTTVLEEAFGVLKKGYAEVFRLGKLGYKNELTFLPKGQLGIILAAVFVVQDRKIISEYRKEHKYQRFDLARILIDTDGNGIDIHTSIFECEVPKKKKPSSNDLLENGQSFIKRTFSMKVSKSDGNLEETQKDAPGLREFIAPAEQRYSLKKKGRSVSFSFRLSKPRSTIEEKLELEDVLKNKKYLKFFKLYATKEFSVENVVFYEEVMNYKELNEKQREKRIPQMMEIFFQSDSIHEINTSKTFIESLLAQQEKGDCSIEFFDAIMGDVIQTNLSDTYQRFMYSELFIEMKEKSKKKKKYFLFQ